MGDHAAAAGTAGEHPELCLNCGTRLMGPHCHECGQAGHVHRTVGAIGHELAHGVLHFEGKIWRTLPLLVLRPGELTRRYIAGERARFVSPLALFLFTVFLLFAVYNWVGPADLAESIDSGVTSTSEQLARGEAEARRALATLGARRAGQTGTAAAETDRAIRVQQTELREIERLRARIGRGEREAIHIESGWPWLDHGVARASANPGLVAYKVQSSAYKYSWALILLSIPFVALLFLWRRGFNLYDHAIFATYSIASMSLLLIAIEVGVAIGIDASLLWLAMLIVPPIHMFVQLRGAYRLSVFSALWRTVLLVCFSLAILLLFVLGLVAMGISH